MNYIGHPMMGSVTNYIYIQNTPGGHENGIGKSSKYWKKTIRGWRIPRLTVRSSNSVR